MTDDRLRRVNGRREDTWKSLTANQFQRLGVSESHSGHVAVEWVPLIQKPIDAVIWFVFNWYRALWKSQITAFQWLTKPPSSLRAAVAGLNLAAWFTGAGWLLLTVVQHVS
jgi:hypothetical protein